MGKSVIHINSSHDIVVSTVLLLYEIWQYNDMLYLQLAGLIEKWGSDVMDEIRSDSRKKQRKENSNEVKKIKGIVKPLTIVHMQGPL